MQNTALIYLYRDASNYKEWGRTVFGGSPSDALEKRLTAALLEGEWFIAHQVGLRSLYLFEAGDPTRDDHIRHEFHSVEETDDSATDPRTFSEMVAAFESANWDEVAEMARVDMVW
ncbi:MAG: hypothetical protein ACQEVA_23035 [Myxococcota bacterium]